MGSMIYFDNNATTCPLDAVTEAVAATSRDMYANPSSLHQFGQRARHLVETAREQVAALIGASPREIVFTSGGTESINLAIRGVLSARPERRHVITTAVEHSAALNLCRRLSDEGFEVSVLSVDEAGRFDADQLAGLLRDDTGIVSLIHANNETGVLSPIEGAAESCAAQGIPVHVDAVQSAAKLPIDVGTTPVSLLSMSAHKFHGPKGVGALYVRRRTRLYSQIVGGSQEREIRAGTENVPGIVGMGVAADYARRHLDDHCQIVGAMRDQLERGLLSSTPLAHVMGGGADRLFNTTNVAFEGLEAEAILILLSEAGICASSGSACSSGSLEPSHVISAMGVDPFVGHGAIRFSLSHMNTLAEVNEALKLIPPIIERLASLQAGRVSEATRVRS